MDSKIVKLLYRSFDTSLNPEEQKKLDEAMEQSDQLRKESERIKIIRKKLEANKEQSFNPFFADKVMQRINKISIMDNNELFYESLFKVFKPVMVAAILLIIGISSYNIANTRQFSLEGVLAVPEVTLEQAFDPSLSIDMED